MGASLIADKVASAMEAKGAVFEGVHTCGRHILGSRVAIVLLDYMAKNDLVRNAQQQGERLLQGLDEIKARHALVGDV
jgi:adenosylmethionine-8-amino-7-oxononanoate aminotransferase